MVLLARRLRQRRLLHDGLQLLQRHADRRVRVRGLGDRLVAAGLELEHERRQPVHLLADLAQHHIPQLAPLAGQADLAAHLLQRRAHGVPGRHHLVERVEQQRHLHLGHGVGVGPPLHLVDGADVHEHQPLEAGHGRLDLGQAVGRARRGPVDVVLRVQPAEHLDGLLDPALDGARGLAERFGRRRGRRARRHVLRQVRAVRQAHGRQLREVLREGGAHERGDGARAGEPARGRERAPLGGGRGDGGVGQWRERGLGGGCRGGFGFGRVAVGSRMTGHVYLWLGHGGRSRPGVVRFVAAAVQAGSAGVDRKKRFSARRRLMQGCPMRDALCDSVQMRSGRRSRCC